MKTTQHLQTLESLVHTWTTELDRYTDEQFLLKPDAHQWSIGQVYMHLIRSALGFHLKQVRLCLEKQSTNIAGGKKLPGMLAFAFGMFPPIRVSVPPSPQYTPPQPSGKEEVRNGLQEVLTAVRAIAAEVEQAPTDWKSPHPAFGYLNAAEWFHLIPMHYKHHFRQQKRLNAFLGVTQ